VAAKTCDDTLVSVIAAANTAAQIFAERLKPSIYTSQIYFPKETKRPQHVA
jgi:hypothetical protein